MTNTQIIQKAIEEIECKYFCVTEQFLEVHKILLVDNKPKIERVDTEFQDGTAVVYFPIAGENFYLAIYLDTKPVVSVRQVNTEPYHSVSFIVTSESLTLEQISSLTTLSPTKIWSKGDRKEFGNAFQKFSGLVFEPNPEVDEFEDKIKKLLDFLEQDKDGILKLVNDADGHIQVISCFHNGNTMLGGFTLEKGTTKRIANLNLAIDFDLYAEGKMLKS